MILGVMGALLFFMSYRRRNNLPLLPSITLALPDIFKRAKFVNQADANAAAASDTTSMTSRSNLANNAELSPSETNNSNIVSDFFAFWLKKIDS